MHTSRFVLFAMLWLAPAVGLAAEGPDTVPPKTEPAKDPKEVEEQVPVHAWGDQIRYVRDKNMARIVGKATIIKKDFRVDADEVQAVMDPKTGQFTEVIATGNVRINTVLAIPEGTTERPELQPRQDMRRAHCEKAIYNLKTEVVILQGTPKKQPMVWINKDQVQADEITYITKEDRATFKGRVKLSALIPVKEEKPTPGGEKEKPSAGGATKAP
jgi:lipopolysaccharide export system protein LptA